MHRGWFPVHRRIFGSDVWQHPTARIVWIYILGSVTHQEVTLSERYQAVTLQPGQALTSALTIAAKCCLSRRSVRTALNYLISTNRVTIKATNRFSIITVTNWPAYRDAMSGNDQQNDQQNDKHPTNSRPTADHIQEDLNKTEKKEKGLPLALPVSGTGAHRSEEDLPLAPPGALREAMQKANLIGQPLGPKDKGNGHDKSVGEGKGTTDFLASLPKQKYEALKAAIEKFNAKVWTREQVERHLVAESFDEQDLILTDYLFVGSEVRA